MPTILRIEGYRLFFYSGDKDEPEHIHVERDDNVVKFWLDPVRLERSGGFNRLELRLIQTIIETHQSKLLEAWHEYFES